MKEPNRKTEISGPGNGCLWQRQAAGMSWVTQCGYWWVQMDERGPEEIYSTCPNCGQPLTEIDALPPGIELLSIHEVGDAE